MHFHMQTKCPFTTPSNSDPSSWNEFDYLLTFKLHKYSRGIHVCKHAWINIQDSVFSALFTLISLSTACSELPENAFTHPTGFQNDSPLFAIHSYSTEVWCKILTSPAHFRRFNANNSANAGWTPPRGSLEDFMCFVALSGTLAFINTD